MKAFPHIRPIYVVIEEEGNSSDCIKAFGNKTRADHFLKIKKLKYAGSERKD